MDSNGDSAPSYSDPVALLAAFAIHGRRTEIGYEQTMGRDGIHHADACVKRR